MSQTTIYLSPATWDMVVDVNGNIAIASSPYAEAQNAASAIKCWIGELYYDTTQGVVWENILGQLPPIEYIRSQLVTAALTVVNVASAQVFFSSFTNRLISGQVQVETVDGQTATAVF